MTNKHVMTVRMDEDLGQRLGFIAQVREQSKNSLIVAAVRQFVFDIENDAFFQEERAAMLERWSGEEQA